MKLTLGFSPCPNDTFIFDALVNGLIPTDGLEFEVVLEDVETLNRWATEGRLDITKLSFSALLPLTQTYALLRSGAALGRGVGPLLVAREAIPLDQLSHKKIAIPGVQTTANLLFSLAFPQATHKTEVVFSDVATGILSGTFDAGLMIHEGRFTYEKQGLVKLLDLGQWWEQTSGAPIPLGGIVMKRTYGQQVYEKVNALIAQSLAYAWRRYPDLSDFITDHAQEMEPDVMRSHIDLYVNDFTTDLGAEGERAIAVLQQNAQAAGLAPAGTTFFR
jgi:1,4-dihydroxy-6-naphthoate synthase